MAPSVLDRFLRFVPTNRNVDGCWEWAGYKNAGGYGRFRVSGKSAGAHRISYMLHRGDIAAGLFVCHSCDNPGCVNPIHLFLGTRQENIADMVKKARRRGVGPKGSDNSRTGLTEEVVAEILKAHGSTKEIATRFGITYSNAWRTRKRETWLHVRGD